jgi:hypothetical protein
LTVKSLCLSLPLLHHKPEATAKDFAEVAGGVVLIDIELIYKIVNIETMRRLSYILTEDVAVVD